MKKSKEKQIKERKIPHNKNNFEIIDFAKIMKGESTSILNNAHKDKIKSMDKIISSKIEKLKKENKLNILDNFNILKEEDLSSKKSHSNSKNLEILNFNEMKLDLFNNSNFKKIDTNQHEGKKNLIKDENILNPEIIKIKTNISKDSDKINEKKFVKNKLINTEEDYISFKTDSSKNKSYNQEIEIFNNITNNKEKINNIFSDKKDNLKVLDFKYLDVDVSRINNKLTKLKRDSKEKEKINLINKIEEIDDIKIENENNIIDEKETKIKGKSDLKNQKLEVKNLNRIKYDNKLSDIEITNINKIDNIPLIKENKNNIYKQYKNLANKSPKKNFEIIDVELENTQDINLKKSSSINSSQSRQLENQKQEQIDKIKKFPIINRISEKGINKKKDKIDPEDIGIHKEKINEKNYKEKTKNTSKMIISLNENIKNEKDEIIKDIMSINIAPLTEESNNKFDANKNVNKKENLNEFEDHSNIEENSFLNKSDNSSLKKIIKQTNNEINKSKISKSKKSKRSSLIMMKKIILIKIIFLTNQY